jgi:hypothetical protein
MSFGQIPPRLFVWDDEGNKYLVSRYNLELVQPKEAAIKPAFVQQLQFDFGEDSHD